MTTRVKLLFALTVVGFVVPNAMVAVYVADHGLDLGSYLGDWFETLPSAQLVADLAICFWAFVAWSAWDGPRTGVRFWWVTIPASLLVGVCFAVPLYLLMRELRLAEGPGSSALPAQ